MGEARAQQTFGTPGMESDKAFVLIAKCIGGKLTGGGDGYCFWKLRSDLACLCLIWIAGTGPEIEFNFVRNWLQAALE